MEDVGRLWKTPTRNNNKYPYSFNVERSASKNISACRSVKVNAGLRRIARLPHPPDWMPVRAREVTRECTIAFSISNFHNNPSSYLWPRASWWPCLAFQVRRSWTQRRSHVRAPNWWYWNAPSRYSSDASACNHPREWLCPRDSPSWSHPLSPRAVLLCWDHPSTCWTRGTIASACDIHIQCINYRRSIRCSVVIVIIALSR